MRLINWISHLNFLHLIRTKEMIERNKINIKKKKMNKNSAITGRVHWTCKSGNVRRPFGMKGQ